MMTSRSITAAEVRHQKKKLRRERERERDSVREIKRERERGKKPQSTEKKRARNTFFNDEIRLCNF